MNLMRLIVGSFMLCRSGLADVSFVDKITNVSTGDSLMLKRASKGQRMVIEREQGQQIVDLSRKTVTVLDNREMVFRITSLNPRPADEEAILNVISGAKIRLTDTGVSSQIGGLKCKKFTISGTTPWPLEGLDSITQAKIFGEVWASDQIPAKKELIQFEATLNTASAIETIATLSTKELPAGYLYVAKTIRIELGSDAAAERFRHKFREQTQRLEQMRPELEESAAKGSKQAKQMLDRLNRSRTGSISPLLNIKVERVDISTKALSETLFEVPAGYREVSK